MVKKIVGFVLVLVGVFSLSVMAMADMPGYFTPQNHPEMSLNHVVILTEPGCFICPRDETDRESLSAMLIKK